MRPIFCFIDDSEFELEVFKKNILPGVKGIEFILGTSYSEIQTKLDNRLPALFLLDLYGPDPDLAPSGIPSRQELEENLAKAPKIKDLYRYLENYETGNVNDYLKKVFTFVDGWRQLFTDIARKTGQSTGFGLELLAETKRDYPATASVAYTRKSMIEDAVAALAAGFDGLSLKPAGKNDNEIHTQTALAADRLTGEWSALVTRSFSHHLQRLLLLLDQAGLKEDTLVIMEGGLPSERAAEVLGEGDIKFLKAASVWWKYSNHPAII